MKKIVLTGGGVVLLMIIMVFGTFFTAPSLVQAESRSFLGANSTTATDPYCEAYMKDLANRLHVSVSTLQQAQQAAYKDMLNQMVRNGKLTQKQAAAMEQMHQSHMMCSNNMMCSNHMMCGNNHPAGMPDMSSNNPHFAVSRRDFVDFFIGWSRQSQDESMHRLQT